MAWPLQAAVTKSSVRSLTSTVDPSASRNTAWAPGPVRTDSRSPMAAPASRVPRAARRGVQTALSGNDRGPRTAGGHHGVDGAASDIHDRDEQRGGRGKHAASHPAGGGPHWHGDDCSLAFHLGDPRATAGTTTEMVFHQDAAAGAELFAQIRAEVLAELSTDGAAGVRHLLPNARPRGLDRAGVHVFRSHLVVVLVPNGLRTSPISFVTACASSARYYVRPSVPFRLAAAAGFGGA